MPPGSTQLTDATADDQVLGGAHFTPIKESKDAEQALIDKLAQQFATNDQHKRILHEAKVREQTMEEIQKVLPNRKKHGDSDRMIYNIFANLFYRTVNDESQEIKNPRSQKHKVSFTTYAPVNWLVSATPTDNGISELVGPLCVLWKKSFELPGDEASDKDRGINPIEAYTDVEYANDILTNNEGYAAANRSLPLWRLCPKSFAKLYARGKIVGDVGRQILMSIYDLIILRMTSATEIDVGDGSKPFRLGNDIPPYQCRVVQLKNTELEAQDMADVFNTYFPYLHLDPAARV